MLKMGETAMREKGLPDNLVAQLVENAEGLEKDSRSKSITSFFTQRTSPPPIPERINIFSGTEYTDSNSQHEVNESVDESVDDSEQLVLLLKMLEDNGYETCSGIPLNFPEPLNKNVPHQLFDRFNFGFIIDKDSCARSMKCTARNYLFGRPHKICSILRH